MKNLRQPPRRPLPLYLPVALMVLVLVASSANAQFTGAERSCRQAIAANGSKLAATVGKTLSRCHKSRLRNKIDVGLDCNDIAQADTRAKIVRAEDKLRNAVGGSGDRCAGLTPQWLGLSELMLYPEINGFAMWTRPFPEAWGDPFPYDSLVRPGTPQGIAFKQVVDANPSSFHSCAYFSDGSQMPSCE